MLPGDILGLPIPDAAPIFAAALTAHVACGLTAVVAGALAAIATKGPGRHPRAGRAYLAALAGIVTTATIMAATRTCRRQSTREGLTVAAAFGTIILRHQTKHIHPLRGRTRGRRSR